MEPLHLYIRDANQNLIKASQFVKQKNIKKYQRFKPLIFLMRPRGLEPPRVIHPLGPQPSASAIPPRPQVLKNECG